MKQQALMIFSFFILSMAGAAQEKDTRNTTNEGNVAGSSQTAVPSQPGPALTPDEWKPLLDPTREEFWYEGNHKPDAGYLTCSLLG